MALQLPRVLKNMNLLIDGSGYAGRVDEITLPVLTIKTEDHRAGGMDIPAELDMGMERLEASMIVSDFSPEIFRSFGLLDSGGVPITVRGATQRQGDATVTPVTVNMIGGWRSLDAGAWTAGAKNPLTINAALTYYKLTVDGEELVEIDAINMIRIINGVDQLAGQRQAIGL
jgi:P2 family phage contractile tail tube protein